ncbi:MAG: bifunctional oligoribonuclease/PAP phosphatase NrnA [Lachnospiraceae bacterium]|nr:bifunctional oligoribonuclease/PAP phosphatase NrnA [Lachnospiraceae bacterium]
MIYLDNFLRESDSAAVAGHVRPDGDCVGSCLAVYNYIRTWFPEIRADLYLEPIPEKFAFLKNADRIRQARAEEDPFVYDLFIALDCADIGRLGDAAGLFGAAKHTICIDHHVTNAGFADVNEVCPGASSASELVFSAMNPERISKEIAVCLYLGIAHDTGIFRYSCTSAETMRVAGELMNKGIDFTKLIDETYYIRTYAQQKIWGKALLDSQLFLDGTCIYSVVTLEDQDTFGVTAADLDGIVSELRSTAGVEVSVFLYESKNGYKISMRSASYVDVAKIAMDFGGGGHVRAAGAFAAGDPDTIRDSILFKIKEQLCITES